jgi:hypothetical protein
MLPALDISIVEQRSRAVAQGCYVGNRAGSGCSAAIRGPGEAFAGRRLSGLFVGSHSVQGQITRPNCQVEET